MADALILGGGLAGAAAAVLLSRAGKTVHLIERETGPHHKICGEFLSIEARHHLVELGIDPARLGAVPIDRVRVIAGDAQIEAKLPFTALGLSRHVLDEALLDRAQGAGARVERGVRVLGMDAMAVRTSHGERSGTSILLATGKLPVREERKDSGHKDADPYVGFKMHYRLSGPARAQLEATVQLTLFDGGYAGLQMVEGGFANLCLIVRRSRLTRIGRSWSDLQAMLSSLPRGGEWLAEAEPLFARPVTIGNLSYGEVLRRRPDDGIFRLGDQAGMTASLTGDGMALALRSAFLAVACLRSGEDAQTYRQRHRAEIGRQLTRAMALQRALEQPLLRSLGVGLLRAWPGLLTYLASATRVTERPAEHALERAL
ncbi:NAD(P)/FAD-dependent oxidoreductase [Novosphingobium pentaromativorans]|uniref:Putative electron transfer oxidoreductase n=1 Tax=Novosphingobium pentaromativorans US6-1 TaxID=1088721 RepID=G6EGV5_9SPHN|nr:FAD-dependent monooxygenase [Novosphingobium pentaromativorans]AIT82053.1 electron transfer flavoprotein [Novosphingobium pentaromativorans US6-1]EHJ59244.1 putative electron transfer oxidoreductase [Novosphingobium pentaromativorans US6-1]